MRIALSGWPDVPATEFVLHMHPYYAGFIAKLYEWAPTIEWYDWVQAFFLAISIIWYFFAIDKNTEHPRGRLLLSLIAFGVILTFFIRIQYTLLACMIAASGSIVAVAYFLFPRNKQETFSFPWKAFIWLVTSWCIACMIREKSLAWVGLFTLPAIIPLMFGVCKKRVLLLLASLAFTALSAFTLRQAHFNYYNNDPQWQHVMPWLDALYVLKEYNTLYDTMNIWQVRAAFKEAVGWSPNDLDMMQAFMYTNSMFNREQLDKAYTALIPDINKARITLLINADWIRLFKRYATVLGPYLLFALVLAAATRNWMVIFYAIFLSAGTILACSITGLLTKPPPFRIWFGHIPLMTGLILLANQAWPAGRITRHAQKTILSSLLILLFMTAQSLHAHKKESNHKLHRHKLAVSDMERLIHYQQKHKVSYVVMGAIFPIHDSIMPYEDISFKALDLPIITGVRGQTPYVQQMLKRHKIELLEKDLCSRPNLLLLTSHSNAHKRIRVKRFVKQHYNMSIQFNKHLHGHFIQVFNCSVTGPKNK